MSNKKVYTIDYRETTKDKSVKALKSLAQRSATITSLYRKTKSVRESLQRERLQRLGCRNVKLGLKLFLPPESAPAATGLAEKAT